MGMGDTGSDESLGSTVSHNFFPCQHFKVLTLSLRQRRKWWSRERTPPHPPGERKCLDHDSDSDESQESTVSHNSTLMTGSNESYLSKLIDYIVTLSTIFYTQTRKTARLNMSK